MFLERGKQKLIKTMSFSNHSSAILLKLPFLAKKYLIELQWRQALPCSSWDTGRVVPLLFSPGVKSFN